MKIEVIPSKNFKSITQFSFIFVLCRYEYNWNITQRPLKLIKKEEKIIFIFILRKLQFARFDIPCVNSKILFKINEKFSFKLNFRQNEDTIAPSKLNIIINPKTKDNVLKELFILKVNISNFVFCLVFVFMLFLKNYLNFVCYRI